MEKDTSLSIFIQQLCLVFLSNIQNSTAVVSTAGLAGSVGQNGLTALGALHHTGKSQLPVGTTSLVSSLLGNSRSWHCHFDTS